MLVLPFINQRTLVPEPCSHEVKVCFKKRDSYVASCVCGRYGLLWITEVVLCSKASYLVICDVKCYHWIGNYSVLTLYYLLNLCTTLRVSTPCDVTLFCYRLAIFVSNISSAWYVKIVTLFTCLGLHTSSLP